MKRKSFTLASILPALTAVTVFFNPFESHAQKVAQGSGNWTSITWDPAGNPSLGDQVNIGNDFEVNYTGDPDEGRVGRIYIGSDAGGFTPNGTLTISGGSLETASNGSLAIQVGHSENSTAVLNVTGGSLKADLSGTGSGGWLNVGNGENSTGTVNLSGFGSIETVSNATLGSALGSLGVMNMTGGFFIVGGDFFMGRVGPNQNEGIFNQSGGATQVDGRVRVGNSTTAGFEQKGTMTLTGGSTSIAGDIDVGNTGVSDLGEGKLSVGPNAGLEITGSSSTLTLGGNAELEFILGSNDSFNAINLTAITSDPALSFFDESLISINGSSLALDDYGPINLISFGSGMGPTAGSLSNVSYDFVGFDPLFDASVAWTDTNFVLSLAVIPEPASVALLLGLPILGWSVVRRRRKLSAH